MDRAEDLYRRVVNGGAAEVDQMVRNQVIEELFLDYKRAATSMPFVKLAASDRKNLAKAIAGFANSEGGVIIWGVDCRSTPNGDVPTGSQPIPDPTAFRSLLEGAISGVTLPAHSGIRNEALPIAGQTKGFVATFVPMGLHVPYRSLGDKEEYYIRAGSNFIPAPHAVLAGLFGRPPQSQPQLKVRVQSLSRQVGFPAVCKIGIKASVQNRGRALVRGLFCTVEMRLPQNLEPKFEFDKTRWQRWRTTEAGVDLLSAVATEEYPLIPPGSENDLFEMTLEGTPAVSGRVLITITCGANGAMGDSHTISVPEDVLNPAIEHCCHEYASAEARRPGDEKHLGELRTHVDTGVAG